MAKFEIFCILAIAALISVEMTAAVGEKKECYEIHPEILCENGNSDQCSAFCQQKFGPPTTVQCIENAGFVGPFCVCNAC